MAAYDEWPPVTAVWAVIARILEDCGPLNIWKIQRELMACTRERLGRRTGDVTRWVERMESEGLVIVAEVRASTNGGMHTRYYKLTQLGREAVNDAIQSARLALAIPSP